MSDVDSVKAGTYELVAVQWDEQTSKPGEPFDFIRHRAGDKVDLDVAEARRLWLAGAIVRPGERERAAAEQARLVYEAALAALPDDVRAQLTEPAASTEQSASRPAQVAPKAEWVDYAVSQGASREEAEGLTKAELVEMYAS